MNQPQLIGYPEVLELTGVSKRTLIDRIRAEGVRVYINGADRRRRLIDRRDVDRLVRITPDPQYDTSREYDGSAA